MHMHFMQNVSFVEKCRKRCIPTTLLMLKSSLEWNESGKSSIQFSLWKYSQTGVSFAIHSYHCCNSSKGRQKNVVRSLKIHSISCCALKSRKKPFRGHLRCYLTNVKLDSFLSELHCNFKNIATKKTFWSTDNTVSCYVFVFFFLLLLHKRFLSKV